MAKLIPIQGNAFKLDGGAMFGNCPKVLWSKWHEPDELNRISMTTRTLLLQTDDGRNVLFESGIGAYMDPKMKERYGIHQTNHELLLNLQAEGVNEEDIDIVILSHLHFDHAGGMLSAFGEKERLLFPKAKIYVGRRHWERALKPHVRERASFIPQLHELLKSSGRLELIEGQEHKEIDFGVTFRYSEGHTVGLMVAMIETDDGVLAFASDVVPGVAWIHLPITMGYDRYPEKMVDEKRSLFEELLTKEGRLFLTHDPKYAIVKVIRQEKSDRYSYA